MGKIVLLDKDVSEKIAAGEVVERPLSVVKELVENSIDAGSTAITVEIKKSGKTYIRITDNGSGIEGEDILLAFRRHATSKVREAEDLEDIGTLGFRGEALASISAVSNVELITRTEDEEQGRRIVVKGGEVLKNGATGCAKGTTIIVSDLFYNTPVREKFMKSDASESSLIIDFMTQMALAYPDIKVMLINNGNTVFSTSGKGDRFETVITLSSVEFGSKLILLENRMKLDSEGAEKINIEGYVSNIGESRNSRKGQIFFVNGRVVNSKVLERAIDEAYSDKLFKGRYPVAYLFLDIPGHLVDVNIHPNKREIRFFDDNLIIDFVSASIKETLQAKFAIPNMDIQEATKGTKNIFITKPKPLTESQKTLHEIRKIIKPGTVQDFSIKKEKENDKPMETQLDIKSAFQEFSKETDRISDDLVEFKDENEKIDIERIRIKEDSIATSYGKEMEKLDFGSLVIKGTVFGTYNIAYNDEELFLIDQHAAHERVNFERILREFNKSEVNVQPIMVPFIISVSLSQYENSRIWMEQLSNFGFEIEDFGPLTFKVIGIPTFLNLSEAESFVNNFLDGTFEGEVNLDEGTLDKIASKACKASVKANYILKEQEIAVLLQDLSRCNNPFTCPHGRPTLIKFTKEDIEKKFKRT